MVKIWDEQTLHVELPTDAIVYRCVQMLGSASIEEIVKHSRLSEEAVREEVEKMHKQGRLVVDRKIRLSNG